MRGSNSLPPEEYFVKRSEELDLQRKKLKAKRRRMPWFRLLAFGLSFIGIYAAWVISPMYWALGVVGVLGFLALSLKDRNLRDEIRRIEFLKAQAKRELRAISNHAMEGNPGVGFIDHDHSYSSDLDVFGENSVFHFLDRTSSAMGRKLLADNLRNAFRISNRAEERQKAVEEWTSSMEVIHEVRFLLSEEGERNPDWSALRKIAEYDLGMYSWIRFVTPAIAILLGVLGALDVLSMTPFYITFILQLVLSGQQLKSFLKMNDWGTQGFVQMRQYAQVIRILEKMKFDSPGNKALHDRLQNANGSASEVLQSLSKILSRMDSQHNVIVTVVLNGLLLWNIHLMLQLKKWVVQNGDQLTDWMDAIAEVEVLHTLASIRFNFPNSIYPEIHRDGFVLDAQDIGHPLIPALERVDNSISIDHWNTYVIITGANMSGKSTFLRTIGINLVLGMIGAPVFAQALKFTPVPIHSSIRTSDSLAKSESYFYAELKRLSQMVQGLEAGERKLILLDEILKGTNSVDKQEGSIALIEKLLKYPSVGFFATHDLALGELASKYPENVLNRSFEIEIRGDQMHIDYRLRPGVCKNLNAAFLMRRMGIVDA